MRLSAVFDDNVVTIDGASRRVTWSSVLPAKWHAFQWYDTVGEMEYGDRNEKVYDSALAALFQSLWNAGTDGASPVADPTTDAVAQARAAVLDQLVLQAAQDPAASQVIKDGAADLDKAGIVLEVSAAPVKLGG